MRSTSRQLKVKRVRQGANEIVVRMRPGHPTQAIVQVGALAFPAAIGRSGRTSRKREGDGATPIATMPVLRGYFRSDRIGRPKTLVKLYPIRKDMLWCDAKGEANYNRPVRAPFSRSHETLRRDDHLYDICLVMDWNIRERKQGAGSAIFFHLARPGFTPTEGCVAVRLRDMHRLLSLIAPGTRVRVI